MLKCVSLLHVLFTSSNFYFYIIIYTIFKYKQIQTKAMIIITSFNIVLMKFKNFSPNVENNWLNISIN